MPTGGPFVPALDRDLMWRRHTSDTVSLIKGSAGQRAALRDPIYDAVFAYNRDVLSWSGRVQRFIRHQFKPGGERATGSRSECARSRPFSRLCRDSDTVAMKHNTGAV